MIVFQIFTDDKIKLELSQTVEEAGTAGLRNIILRYNDDVGDLLGSCTVPQTIIFDLVHGTLSLRIFD